MPLEKLTYLQDGDENNPENQVNYSLKRAAYLVQTGDILAITIKTSDQRGAMYFNNQGTSFLNQGQGDLLLYLNGYTINPAGFLELPVLGQIKVVDKTLEEVKFIVETLLNEYFKDAATMVSVQMGGIRFSIIGDVVNPGRYVIYQNQVNVFEALALSGDITVVGNRKSVQIIRQIKNDSLVTVNIDLTDTKILESEYFFLQPNDIINVKPLSVKTLGIGTSGFQTFASILAVLASSATLIFTLNQIGKS